MDWHTEIDPTPSGRLGHSFSKDLESVLFAVFAFLSGGIILFMMCFVVTKCMQCYKARIRRKRRQAMGDDDDDDELAEAVLAGAFESCDDDEEQSRLVEL